MYTSINEKAKMLRSEIKKQLGLNSRVVSVTANRCTYDSAINVVAKTVEAISHFEEISKIASKFEKIDYDEYSGEILGGGNTYVNVGCDRDVLSEYSNKYIELATKCYNEMRNETYGKCVLTINGVELHYIPMYVYPNSVEGICWIDIDRHAHKNQKYTYSARDIAISMAQFEICGYFCF